MKTLIASAAVIAATLCSLAIPVAPALGLEFEGEATSSLTPATTAQIIHLGTYLGNARWIECSKVEMKAALLVGAFTKLTATQEEYEGCVYNRELKSEVVETTEPCAIVLESANLLELAEEEFGEGNAKFNCTLEFLNATGSGCQVTITGPTTVQPEYAWTNINGTPLHYESVIRLKLKNLKYTISKLGAGSCSSVGSGTNGEYVGSVPVKYVTIFPEF